MLVPYMGYLLKVDGVIFPNDLILFGSFSITPNQRQDLDSYRDSIGYLHRNILPHKPSKIEFTTKILHDADRAALENILKNRDEYSLEYWDKEYKSGKFYTPDIKYEIYDIDKASGAIRYKPVRIAMIEY